MTLTLLVAAGCTRTVGDVLLRIVTSPNVDEKPLEGADDDLSIEVRVEGPGAGVHRATEPYVPQQTHVRVPEITVGPDRVITVTVRNGRGDDVARARSLPWDMTGDDTNLRLYLSLVGHSSEAGTRLTRPRFRHTATPLPDGRILIAGGGTERAEGGWVDGLDPVPHAEIFDPTSGSIVTTVPDCERFPTGNRPPLCLYCRRIGQTSGVDDEGAPVLAAGDTTGCTYVDRFAADRFDAIVPRMELGAGEATSFDSADGVVVAGGLVGGEPSRQAVLVAADGVRRIEGGLEAARYAAAAAALPGGGGVVLGGFVSTPGPGAPPGCICEDPCDPEDPVGPPCRSRGTVTGSIEVYDPGSRTFEELPDALAEPRAYATATTLPDGRVVVIGGLGETLLGVGGQNLPTASVELFDPDRGISCEVATLAIARWMHAAVAASARPEEGRIVIFGGYENLGEVSSSIEVLDLSTVQIGSTCPTSLRGATVLAERMSVRRAGHTGTRMANGAILLAGGVTRLSQEGSEGTQPGVSDVLDVFWVE